MAYENMNPFGQINGYNGVSAGNTQNLKYGKTANNQFYHFGNDMKSNPNDFLGSNFGYLNDKLKQGIEGNNPIFDQLFGNAQRRIGASTDRNVQDIKEQGAQSGFRGAGGNLINDAYRGEKEALSGVSDSLAMQEMNYQQNAINQLLGLNQFEGQTKFGSMQSDRNYGLSKDQLAQQWEMFAQQLQFQRENMPSEWEGILGSLIGGGAQVGTAALLASDERVKENIKKVGQKDDIDIVEFNYIGGSKRYRGVTAQQIEGNHPEAVKEINGIKYVDYSKIGLTMEAI